MLQAGLRLPPGYLDIPERMNMAEHTVTRHVLLGQGDRPALHCGATTLTFAEVDLRMNRFGSALGAAGIRPGERFLVPGTNAIDPVIAVLGGMKAGAVPVVVPAGCDGEDLARIAAATEARMVFGSRTYADLVEGQPDDLVAADTLATDTAYVWYGPHPAGQAGGVAHAHRAVISAGDPIRYGLLRLAPDDRCLVPDGWASTMGLEFNVFFPLAAGASGVLYQGPSQPDRVLDVVEEGRVTVLVASPDFYAELCDTPPTATAQDISSVRAALCAGPPLTSELHHEVRRRFGLEVRNMTGRPDAHVYVANHPDLPVKPGSLGVPLPGRKVAILHDGREAAVGEIGRLCLRADDPALARIDGAVGSGAVHEGWYDTGERAFRDDDGDFWPAR